MRRLAVFAFAFAAGIAFGGIETLSKDWKCVYSSSEGPEGKALVVLTERVTELVLRDRGSTTSYVLPLEKDGTRLATDKPHRIVVGRPQENATLRRYLKDGDIPKDGYLIKTVSEEGHNAILLAGDTPSAVLWAALDFCSVDLYEIMWLGHRYFSCNGKQPGRFVPEQVFSMKTLPAYERRTAPETPVRSLFAWGHVIDDYRQFFRECAKMRLNRVLLWNEFPPVNAKEVVREAHAWGLEVYWSFAWGWSTDCTKGDFGNLDKLVDGIVKEWHEVWEPLGGDGIYFQTFTERYLGEEVGKSVSKLAAEVVNAASRRIRAKSPSVDIVFGLHAQSVKANPDLLKDPTPEAIVRQQRECDVRFEEIETTDKGIEILWENCGGFAFNEATNRPDVAFTDKLLLNTTRPVGLVWKCQQRQDWSCWAHQAGPFLLGEAGARTLARDRRVSDRLNRTFDDAWFENGVWAWELMRHVRAGKRPPKELNLVTEYNPPFAFSTLAQAELAWSTAEDWETIRKRVMARVKAKEE